MFLFKLFPPALIAFAFCLSQRGTKVTFEIVFACHKLDLSILKKLDTSFSLRYISVMRGSAMFGCVFKWEKNHA